jgi:hypothetical protein
MHGYSWTDTSSAPEEQSHDWFDAADEAAATQQALSVVTLVQQDRGEDMSFAVESDDGDFVARIIFKSGQVEVSQCEI